MRVGTASAGFKRADRDDLVLFELAPGSRCAALFTRNAFAAAPVLVARRHLGRAAPRYLLVNSGNANAGTGAQGEADALATCALVGAHCGCAAHEVLPFSTGVIGMPLPVQRFGAALPRAVAALDAGAWDAAARAIMTTDTVAKSASEAVVLEDGRRVTVTGIAKGSGMICPDMATMLAFVATDADLAPELLAALLGRAVRVSFNCITVDGDTSTNDACVLVATGAAGGARIARLEDAGALDGAITRVCERLARAIVRDGEGATRLVAVEVRGGASEAECRRVAYTVAHSPLVKTALFAGDPNWGRILAAVGRAGVEGLAIAGVGIDIDGIPIVRGGARIAGFDETPVARIMRGTEYTIGIDLGRGAASARLWTCDLSYDYVRINAEYRT